MQCNCADECVPKCNLGTRKLRTNWLVRICVDAMRVDVQTTLRLGIDGGDGFSLLVCRWKAQQQLSPCVRGGRRWI
jgi:hypothetical protein